MRVTQSAGPRRAAVARQRKFTYRSRSAPRLSQPSLTVPRFDLPAQP